ncbi:hypothetical protein L195_g040056, partial [Trifolium pratense]
RYGGSWLAFSKLKASFSTLEGDERMTNARQGSVQQLRSTARPEANLPPTGRKRRKPNAKGMGVALRMAHQT